MTVPGDACPVLAGFLTGWADGLSGSAFVDGDDAARLERHRPHLVGSRVTPEVQAARAALACDWLVHTVAVTWLRRAGLDGDADALAALPDLTSAEPGPAVERARAEAAAAWNAARTTAWGARGPFVGMAYGNAVAAALDRTLGAVRDASLADDLDAALDSTRRAVLAAGRVSARGSIPPAVLGHAYDTAVDATYDTVPDAMAAAAGAAALAAAQAGDDIVTAELSGSAHDVAVDAALSVALGAAFGPAYRAAYDGDHDAPRMAVRAASLSEARAALEPTVGTLRASAFDLLRRMARLTEAARGSAS